MLLIFNGFITTVLWPWHLLATCSFGLLGGTAKTKWLAVLTAVTAMLSYFLTFPVAALGVTLCAGVSVFLRRKQG